MARVVNVTFTARTDGSLVAIIIGVWLLRHE